MNSKGSGYKFQVTVFGSRNQTTDPQILADARKIGEFLGKNQFVTVNGGSDTGMMGEVAKAAHSAGGEVVGIALGSYDAKPNAFLTQFEAYHSHSERQHRLFELGDLYVALPGAVGTFHEVLEAHILNILGEFKKPIVLVGSYFEKYRELIEYFKTNNLMHVDDTQIMYAKNAEEAIVFIDRYVADLKRKDYYSPIYYPALGPEQIFAHVIQNANPYEIWFSNILMTVFPGVYPSNRFRSSKFFASMVRELSKGKNIADIGCGHGAMGLVALDAGAHHAVMSDINSEAVRNTRFNIQQLGWDSSRADVFEGSVFEPIPNHYKHSFDIIFFNPPFHKDASAINNKLMNAFLTKGQENGVLDQFLKHAKSYLAKDGYVIVGFSNKDKENMEYLEKLFGVYQYAWELVSLKNAETVADDRIYKVWAK